MPYMHVFAEENVTYIPQDSAMVLHLPVLPVLQLVTSPHALAEVGLGSDLNGQSLAQKPNALLLCQRPDCNVRDYVIYSSILNSVHSTKWSYACARRFRYRGHDSR